MKSINSYILRRSIWSSLKSAWEEAFPPEIDIQKRKQAIIEKIKEQKSILNKVYNQEELDLFEARIPLWKKNAIQFVRVVEDISLNKQKSKKVLNDYLRKRYANNADFIQLLDELGGLQSSKEIMKDNLKQKILYSNSEVINASIKIMTKINQKLNVDALVEMKKRNPNFDPDIFEKEIRYIFEEMYHEFLMHNMKYLEKICVGEALGHFRELISEHKAKFGVPKYTDILNVSYPLLQQSFVTEDKIPIFCFSINFQEISCLIDPKNPETILDGDEQRMTSLDYAFYVMPHPNPDIESTGHEWLFFKIVQTNKVRQLV